jgi:intracellular septation protein
MGREASGAAAGLQGRACHSACRHVNSLYIKGRLSVAAAKVTKMKQVLKQLFVDFFSTVVFVAIYLPTGNIYVATAVAVGGGIGQFALARHKGRRLDLMNWASLGLVLALGGATMLTGDPRFVMFKPSIAHFAIGAIMLRRGWMLRYVPPVVTENVSARSIVIAGYCWAALMLTLGLLNIAIAATGDMRLWAWFISVGAVGAKVLAFLLQYLLFRSAVYRKIRATMRETRPVESAVAPGG